MKQLRYYVAVLVASTGLIPPVSSHTIPAAVSAAAGLAACAGSVPTRDHIRICKALRTTCASCLG